MGVRFVLRTHRYKGRLTLVGIKKIATLLGISAFLSACGGGESADAGAGARDVDTWWAEIETCVNKKETAKKSSEDSHVDTWMYDEWETQCVSKNPYSTDPSVQDYIERMEVQEVVDVELELQVSNYTAPVFNVTVGRLDITSLNDYVEIHGVQVNRGNCKASQSLTSDVMNFPVTLGYAQSTTVYLHCKANSVREVSVGTNEGEYSYSFSQ